MNLSRKSWLTSQWNTLKYNHNGKLCKQKYWEELYLKGVEYTFKVHFKVWSSNNKKKKIPFQSLKKQNWWYRKNEEHFKNCTKKSRLWKPLVKSKLCAVSVVLFHGQWLSYLITPPRIRGGVIFSLQFVCVCVRLISCEQNSSRKDSPIWTRFSLNGCLLHWLGLYWNWWPLVKGQGHSDVVPIFFLNSMLTSLLCISASICPIIMKFGISLRYTLGRLTFKIS